MTCRDCLIHDICKEKEKLMLTVDNLYELIYQEAVEVSCRHFKNKADVVEVVRCKDCAYRRVPTRCSLWIGTTDKKEHFREHGDNFYCAFGTPKERGADK